MKHPSFASYMPNVGLEFATYVYHYGPYHYRDFKSPDLDCAKFRMEIAEQLYAIMRDWA